MSALDFIAGLGGAYAAIDRGMQVDRERKQAEEDRAYLQEQRGLLRQQQQREREAQERAETLRKDLAAIPTTETYKADLNKEMLPEGLTNYDDGAPLVPAMVDRTRRRTVDAQLRDASAVYRKTGDLGRALELNAAADKEMFSRAARSFAQLRAGAGNMTAAQIARQAKSIFDSDPFPMEVAAIREGQGGAISIDIRNRDTGQTATWNAKNKDELLSGIEAYYSPDSFAALDQARRKAAIDLQAKRDEELYKPRVLKPGESVWAYSDRLGSFVRVAQGNLRDDEELVTDTNGNSIVRRKQTKDVATQVNDALKLALDGSAKDMTTDAVARANALAHQFAAPSSGKPGVAPQVAVDVAIQAAKNPALIRPMFDDQTGEIVNAIEYRGGNLVVDSLGGVRSPVGVKPEVMKSIAGEYVSKVPSSDRALMVAASMSGEARGELERRLEAAVRAPESLEKLKQAIGRDPTADDIARAVKAAKDRIAPALDLIGLHFDPAARADAIKGSGFTLSGGKVVREQPAPAAGQSGAGGSRAPSGQPAVNPDSPAAKNQAMHARIKEEQRQREEARRKAVEEASREFMADADRMSAIDVVLKWQDRKGTLSPEATRRLFEIERSPALFADDTNVSRPRPATASAVPSSSVAAPVVTEFPSAERRADGSGGSSAPTTAAPAQGTAAPARTSAIPSVGGISPTTASPPGQSQAGQQPAPSAPAAPPAGPAAQTTGGQQGPSPAGGAAAAAGAPSGRPAQQGPSVQSMRADERLIFESASQSGSPDPMAAVREYSALDDDKKSQALQRVFEDPGMKRLVDAYIGRIGAPSGSSPAGRQGAAGGGRATISLESAREYVVSFPALIARLERDLRRPMRDDAMRRQFEAELREARAVLAEAQRVVRQAGATRGAPQR